MPLTRGAQLSNMEEAIRQVKLSLKALEEEHARVLAAKVRLHGWLVFVMCPRRLTLFFFFF